MESKTAIYKGCEFELETFPEVKRCGRPVRITPKIRAGGTCRCELHPVKVIWPGAEEPAAQEAEAYPQITDLKSRAEWQAWQDLAKLVESVDPAAGKHKAGCGCDGIGCKIFNAVRAWGKEFVSVDGYEEEARP